MNGGNNLTAISGFPDFISNTLYNQIYKIDALIFDLNDKINSILFGPVTLVGPVFISSPVNSDCSGTTGGLILAGGASVDLDISVGGRVLTGNGSATTPSLSFCNAQGSGLYYPGNGNGVNLSCNTNDIAQFTCSPPNVNFISTVNILDPALTQADCNGNGSLKTNGGAFINKNIVGNEQIFMADGIATIPSYTFCSNPTTGLFSNVGTPSQLSITAGGIDTVDITPNNVTINGNEVITQALTVQSTLTATCVPNQQGAVVVAGGVSIGGNLCTNGPVIFGGPLTITDLTPCTCNGTGALTVNGGISALRNICLSTINNSQILNANGSAPAPSYAFCNFPNSGMFASSITSLSFAVNSVDIVDINQGAPNIVSINGSATVNSGVNNTLCTPASGALQITGGGGLGVSGNATIGGSMCINGNETVAGDISITTAGNGLEIKQGLNARLGTAILVGGTVTVPNTSVSANTRIFAFTQNPNAGTPGALYTSAIVPGTSFTINSTSGLDTSTFSWLLIEAI